jgi:hypothetical protein
MKPDQHGTTEAMVEAGVAAFDKTETLSVRRLLEVAYPAMRAADPTVTALVEALVAFMQAAKMDRDPAYARLIMDGEAALASASKLGDL